jgi:hypothetical protein
VNFKQEVRGGRLMDRRKTEEKIRIQERQNIKYWERNV